MPASDHDTDPTLCALAANGDQRAFRVLVSRHENRLRSFLSRVAGADLADDLAQEAFVKAWRGLKHFRGDSQFSSWICSIGWRCFLDHARRNRSRQALVEEGPQDGHPDVGLELQRLLSRLTSTERAALILCEGHGWSHPEAASILAMPLGTLKSAVRRAKEKCRLGNGGAP